MGKLGKIIVATSFKKLPKVQKIAQSGHTDDEGEGEGGIIIREESLLGTNERTKKKKNPRDLDPIQARNGSILVSTFWGPSDG